MQNDLISRSALLEIFNHDLACFEANGKSETKMYISVADMRKMIEEQPTAYDVEKVVERLDKASDYYECDEQGREHVQMVDFMEALEIVRNGGEE